MTKFVSFISFPELNFCLLCLLDMLEASSIFVWLSNRLDLAAVWEQCLVLVSCVLCKTCFPLITKFNICVKFCGPSFVQSRIFVFYKNCMQNMTAFLLLLLRKIKKSFRFEPILKFVRSDWQAFTNLLLFPC